MTFYAATLVELLIIELFVLVIWFRVLLEALASNDGSLSGKKVVLTSIGLVLSSVAVGGIMTFRIYELTALRNPFVSIITIFYVTLAISGFLFMLSAAIGTNTKLIRMFASVSVIWTAYCFLDVYF